ncbi:MAG: hypothetical protein MUC92_05470 [Fimbriimonadaceae bacterium]|jgi:hypothetical protein|nr:hypothetical protein [Fimbriimonadaceae bacterium]
MKFRKLYWVTEAVRSDGSSSITGVYTSIPDLMNKGLGENGLAFGPNCLRLTLVKLDSSKEPLGAWTSPTFEGMREALEEFVETQEFNGPACDELVAHLHHSYKSGTGV